MLFSSVSYLLPLLIISSQAHLTVETIMKKEMDWAKNSMEKHHVRRGHLPLRSKVPRAELYPRPDIDYDEDENIDQDSSLDLNYVSLLMEPDQASDKIIDHDASFLTRSRIRTEQVWDPLTIQARNHMIASAL
jgi:hypothetical protein